jgi:hypothetical protein
MAEVKCEYLYNDGYFFYRNEKCENLTVGTKCERCKNVVCENHITEESFTTRDEEVMATVCIDCRCFIVEYGDMMSKSSLGIGSH